MELSVFTCRARKIATGKRTAYRATMPQRHATMRRKREVSRGESLRLIGRIAYTTCPRLSAVGRVMAGGHSLVLVHSDFERSHSGSEQFCNVRGADVAGESQPRRCFAL